MRRATVNFWIDAVIAVAFLISAFTGILFLLPVSWRSVSEAGGAAMLGVSITAWHTLHDWSGIVAAVGVVAHAALHLRWFVNMARRIARGEEGAGQRPLAQPVPPSLSATPVPSPAPPVGAPVAPSRTPAPVAAAVVAASADDDDRRFSRRAFVVGLGTAVGTAAVLGAGALLRNDTSSAGVQVADAQSGNGWQGGAQGNGWQGDGSLGGGSAPSDGSGSSGTTSGQRAVVDSSSCIGCGRCLQVCPYGVFAWNGGKAVAQNPDACQLCGHCVRVCPAGSITLNG